MALSSGPHQVVVPANTVAAKKISAAPVPPTAITALGRVCLLQRLRMTMPAIGAMITSARPSHRMTSFGQATGLGKSSPEIGLSAGASLTMGSNLFMTSELMCAVARSIDPICRSLAVRPMGMHTRMKSRKRRMSRRAMMMARGTAASRSTW